MGERLCLQVVAGPSGEIFDEKKYFFPIVRGSVDQASGFLVNALPSEHVRKFN